MSEWKEVKLGDIVDINKSTYSIKDKWDYISYLDTGNITKGVIDNIQVYEDIDTIPSRARRKVMKNDIIYSCVRPNQRHYGFISEPIDNLLVSTGFATISTKPEKANAKYLYYFLTQNEIVEYLQNIGEQAVSTYPTIKPSDISNIEIKIPSIKIQSEIAGILSSLDAKIETNNKLNEKLEEMTQAIFKSWFVDYEPFKDKPFHETELGMIPEGWEVKRISENDFYISDFVSNGSFASLKQNVTLLDYPDYAYFIRNTDLKVGKFKVYVNKESYDFLSKSKLIGGEIIISNVGDVGSVFLCPKLEKPMTLGNNIKTLQMFLIHLPWSKT